ncbi:MAG: ADP-ribosylglycohydrolase family protein [Clostridia bacterium]|nr:ADP-ribosylglycohydrolase family protein [Clostridia bacterium]
MWGAIIGDIAGSIYEFNQLKGIKSIECNEIISQNGFFSDDTILTIAIANAIETDKDYEKYLKYYGKKYEIYKPDFEPYFKSIFSPGFIKWINGQKDGNSIGNGAMMRISSVGYMFNSEKEVVENVILATKPSHNSEEAIECSKIIALIIYYARQGWPKDEILKKLNINLQYKPFQKFNTTCKETINNCLYALFESKSFEESLKKVISFGGDTDTNACIVGSMAEAMYGVSSTLIESAKCKIPREFIDIIEKEYKTKKKEDIEK